MRDVKGGKGQNKTVQKGWERCEWRNMKGGKEWNSVRNWTSGKELDQNYEERNRPGQWLVNGLLYCTVLYCNVLNCTVCTLW